MNNRQPSQQSNTPPNPPPANRWIRLIDYIKRKVQERKAKYKNESPVDRAARRTADATVWMALLTIVLSACAVGGIWISKRTLDELKGGGAQIDQEIAAMNGQLNVMKDQLAESRAEQRAWVVPTIDSVGRLLIAGQRASIDVSVSFKNVGKLPGEHVFVFLHLYPVPVGADQAFKDSQRPPFCDNDVTVDVAGLVSFPDNVGGSIRTLATTGGPGEMPPFTPLNGDKQLEFVISGCAKYFSGNDPTPHVTGIYGSLARPDSSSGENITFSTDTPMYEGIYFKKVGVGEYAN